MTTPYGYQQGPPPAMGRLVVHSSFNPLAFMLALSGVKVTVNGQPAKVGWGQAPFDLPAGNYHVRVSARYLGDFGPAELPVAVYPGQQTTVFYRPPATIGMKGSLGFQPQKTRGMSAMMAVNVIVVFLAIVVIVVLAAS